MSLVFGFWGKRGGNSRLKVDLAYGHKALSLEVPKDAVVITPRYEPPLRDEAVAVRASLRHPMGTLPLREMVKPTDRVAIVISDITRPTPNHKLISWLLEELEFVPRENFVVINGTGTHRDNTREELVQMLGREVVDTIRIEQNHAQDKNSLKYLGESRTGAPVYLNREYCEADFRIVTGFIEPHFFAGFSGGPKGVMPGVAGLETILPFHSASLIGHPKSTWGILEGNPLQEEAMDIALMCKPEFLLNVTLNGDKEITGFFAGDLWAAHRAGCDYVRSHAMVAVENRFDLVITTNSGYPLDQNLYQAVKGMSAAQQIVRRGGVILAVSECSDGVPNHGNYAKILQMRDTPEQLLEMIADPSFSMFDQWQVQKQALVQTWARVFLYSGLDDESVRQAKLAPIHDLSDQVEQWVHDLGPKARVAVLPLGPLTIPYVSH